MGGRHLPARAQAEIFALGHSTRPLDELVSMLDEHGIATLADIRTVPRSRRNPQFNADVLGPALAARGLRYERVAELGGLRKPRPDSPNTEWSNASFRGYADHMLTPEFAAGLDHLLALTAAGPVAMMCAEAVPWRCHRSLVADALAARGIPVTQLYAPGQSRPHRLTPFAHIQGTQVTYPATP